MCWRGVFPLPCSDFVRLKLEILAHARHASQRPTHLQTMLSLPWSKLQLLRVMPCTLPQLLLSQLPMEVGVPRALDHDLSASRARTSNSSQSLRLQAKGNHTYGHVHAGRRREDEEVTDVTVSATPSAARESVDGANRRRARGACCTTHTCAACSVAARGARVPAATTTREEALCSRRAARASGRQREVEQEEVGYLPRLAAGSASSCVRCVRTCVFVYM